MRSGKEWVRWVVGASALVVIGAGVVLATTDGQSEPGRSLPSRSQTPTVDAAVGKGATWPIRLRGAADLDGDGTDEEVRVRVRPPPLVRERMRIESDLSSGGRVHGFLGSGGLGYALETPFDADRDGDDEVVIWREAARTTLAVFDVRGPRLVQASQPHRPTIQSGPLGTMVDGIARQQDWWFERGRLFSSRSVDSFPLVSQSVDLPDVYAAVRWRWTMVGGAMVPGRLGRPCVRRDAPREPFPCPAQPRGPLPVLFPAATAGVAPGGSLIRKRSGLPTRTITLGRDGIVAEVDGRRSRVDFGEWLVIEPRLLRTPVETGARGGVLLTMVGVADAAGYIAYVWANGALVAARPVSDVPFGSSPSFANWLTEDGALFSQDGKGDAGPVPGVGLVL